MGQGSADASLWRGGPGGKARGPRDRGRRCGGGAWAQWLGAKGIVALEDVDTRKLVLRIREAGAMRAAAVADERDLDAAAALEVIREQPSMEGQALVSA